MSNAAGEPKRDFLGRVIAEEAAADAGGFSGIGRSESIRADDNDGHTQRGDSRGVSQTGDSQNKDSAEMRDAIGSFVREKLRQKSVAACEHFLDQGSGTNFFLSLNRRVLRTGAFRIASP